MSQHELLLSADQRRLRRLPATDFLWRPRGETSSFHTTLSPRAQEIGPVPEPAVELIRLAVLAYLVDRTTPRPGRGWLRTLELVVPVANPTRWDAATDRLGRLLNFLTGDDWSLEFVRRRAPRPRVVRATEPAPLVCLFSGGADSLCGLLVAASKCDALPHLVSHWDWTVTGGIQVDVLAAASSLMGGTPTRDRVRIGRTAKQIVSGAPFAEEGSSRSRSLLFLALGLAAASVREAELWVPENGFASLNLPLAGERRGALSTRTTHPHFLDELAAIVRAAGIHATIVNPFEHLTKGEIFARAAKIHGRAATGKLLSLTHSCARTGANYAGFNPATHCGVCFGCLVRRGAFAAAGLTDRTTYIERELLSDAGRRTRWLTPHRRADYETTRYAIRRRYQPEDVVAAALPARVRAAEALALANRGLDELAEVKVP